MRLFKHPLISRRSFLLSSTVCCGLTLQGEDEASPIVEVDKPIFARGEVIRVWVGVNTSGLIPEEKQRPGVLHIIRPDGVRESQSIPWHVDGVPDWSWKGGVSLGNSPVTLGRYRLSFEWDRKQSPEVGLTVREWDLQNRIIARWVIEGTDFRRAAAVLSVENQTDQVLRFARLGTTDSYVWLSCSQDGPHPSHETVGYPYKELLPDGEEHTEVERRWQNLARLPLVKVEPHSQFSQVLDLAKVNLQFPVTTPELEISTVLTVFVGEERDAESAMYPVRLQVLASRRFS